VTSRLVYDGHVRFDSLLIDQPGKHRRRSVGGIANQTLWSDVKALLDALDHEFGRFNFCRAAGLSRFHINNNAVSGVDQIVRRVGEEGAVACGSRPQGLRVGQ